jgi:hypothetical protein
LTERYRVYVNDIISGHSCDSALHPKGRAADIGRITDPLTGAATNFHSYTAADNQALDSAFLTYLVGLLPAGAGLGQSQCPGHGSVPAAIRTFPDSCTHQHVGI